MKMRTLVKGCGYKRRSGKMIEELNKKLLKLELYITDGFEELSPNPRDYITGIEKLGIGQYIRIYSH